MRERCGGTCEGRPFRAALDLPDDTHRGGIIDGGMLLPDLPLRFADLLTHRCGVQKDSCITERAAHFVRFAEPSDGPRTDATALGTEGFNQAIIDYVFEMTHAALPCI